MITINTDFYFFSIFNVFNMRFIQNLFFVACFITNVFYGQSPDFQWAHSTQGYGFDFVRSSVLDEEGNVYSTGWYGGTLYYTIDGIEDSLMYQGGDADMFVEKRTADGDLVWIKNISGIGPIGGDAIAIDNFGHIAVIGNFGYSIDVNPGPGVDSLHAEVDQVHRFLVKLEAQDGDFVWGKKIYGHLWKTTINNVIKFDNDGNLYHSGSFEFDFDINPNPTESEILTANNGRDLFVQKLDVNGDLIWGKQIELQTDRHNRDVTSVLDVTSTGEVVIAGTFQDTIDLDLGAGTDFVYSPDMPSVYIIKLDAQGNSIWTSTIVGQGGDLKCPIVHIDYDDNIYLQGFFQDTLDFNPGFGIENVFPENGNLAVFILKLDENGNYTWVSTIETEGISDYMGLDVDVFGHIYSGISYFLTAEVPTVSGTSTHTSQGQIDILLTQLNSSGEFIWSSSFGGNYIDRVQTVLTNKTGEDLITSGVFNQMVDFDPGADVYNIEAYSASDGYIQKLGFCHSAVIDEHIQCEPLTWIDGNTYDLSSNLEVSDTLINSNGCDSIVYLNLIIPTIDTNLSLMGTDLVCNQSGASYQWLDCNQGMAEIPGETAINFYPQEVGSYAVEITYGSCIVISECFEVEQVSITEEIMNGLNVYSNPMDDQITIHFGKQYDQASIRIYNLLGQDIVKTSCSNKEIQQISIPNAKGIYFIDVQIGQARRQFKLIKH